MHHKNHRTLRCWEKKLVKKIQRILALLAFFVYPLVVVG
jgi:hypothetical protein